MTWIFLLLCHLSLAISTLAINPSQVKVIPENGVSGVFLASLEPVQNKSPPYAFNASQAREVCLMLNMIIATRAQVEEAHRNGLETCRYGWVDEQIAVLPRITASQPCGQNRVGVIIWRSVPTRLFDAFCFRSSDTKTEAPLSTTSKPTPTPSSSPTLVPSHPRTSPLPRTTQSAPSFPPPAIFSSTLSPPRTSPDSQTLPSSTYLSPFTSPSHSLPLTTSPVHPMSVPPSPTNTESPRPEPQDRSSSASPLGVTASRSHSAVSLVVPAVLGAIAILLLLATVTALWYYKMSRSRIVPFCNGSQQKDDFETEVWENLCHKEEQEQHTELEMGGVRNDCKEFSLGEDSLAPRDSP